MGAINLLPKAAGRESNSIRAIRILTDEFEPDPILNFDGYGDSIVSMVRTSYAKFSIGIYGEWGTGKTTLMKLVEYKLNHPIENDTFAWDNIVGNSYDSIRLKSFLRDNYNINWIDNIPFVKDDEKTLIISDTSYTRRLLSKGTYEDIPQHLLSIKLNDNSSMAILSIDGEDIGEFMVKKQADKLYLKTVQTLTVWFNAWRYEREEQFALIALMKTIAYAMGDLPTYRKVKNVFLRGLEIIGKDVLRHFALQYAMTDKGVKEFEENLFPTVELLSMVDKDTIYFEGMKKIDEEMKKIARTNRRIVIFIDDLDRCEARKALEVFESTKVFLDIEGFIFIIGLSHDTLSKLLDLQYQPIGVKGEEYIRKIIQVYINLPKWKNQNVSELINIFSARIGEEYKDFC
jgi:predicted KAP-like P-loop ATPase